MKDVQTPLSDNLDKVIAELIECYTQLLALETSTGDRELKRKLRSRLVCSELKIRSIASKVGVSRCCK